MINDLLKALRESNLGARIGLIPTGNPAHADDIAIVTLHKPNLKKLLDIAYKYSCTWHFEFNASKTEVLIFGEDACPKLHLSLGDKIISVRQGASHMGIALTSNRKYECEYVQDKINSAKRAYYCVQGLGNSHIPVTPMISSKLYWAISIPIMTHGMEIATLSEQSVRRMEQAHGEMAKCIQNLPPQTSNCACLAPLGWTSMECFLDRLKLMFLWRLLLMSVNSIYKQVAIAKLCYYLYQCTDSSNHTSPIPDMLNTFRKYNILCVLIDGITTGCYMPIEKFKVLVKTSIAKVENERFSISCSMYKTLGIFTQCIPMIKLWSWWTFAMKRPDKTHSCILIARLMYGESSLNVHTARFQNNYDVCCQYCDMMTPQTVAHLLFQCTNEQIEACRARCLEKLVNSMPNGLKTDFLNMEDSSKVILILSGMHIPYINEWEDVYESMADFIYKMYNTHSELVTV